MLVMIKIGRNKPCPCDSGLKYKQCCQPRHLRARYPSNPVPLEEFGGHYARLDELDNRITDLLLEKRYDDAEQTANQLCDEYPQDPDGLERLAEVHATRGDRVKAALAFRQAAAFHEVMTPSNRDIDTWLRQQAERMDQGLDIEWPEDDPL